MFGETDIEEIVEGARGSINTDLLTKTGNGGFLNSGYFHDLLIDRVPSDEQLHYVLTNKRKGLTIDRRKETKRFTPSIGYRAAALVTDQQTIFVIGESWSDIVFHVSHDNYEDVETSTGVLKDKLVLRCGGTEYRMHTKKGAETQAAANYIDEVASSKSVTAKESTKETNTGTGNDSNDRDYSGVSRERVPADTPYSGDSSTDSDSCSATTAESSGSASNTVPDNSTIETSGRSSINRYIQREANKWSQIDKEESTSDTQTTPANEQLNTEEFDADSESDVTASKTTTVHRTKADSEAAKSLGLPSPDKVTDVHEDAATHVTNAYDLLLDDIENATRSACIRAHSELCVALEMLDGDAGSVTERLEDAIIELEDELTSTRGDAASKDIKDAQPANSPNTSTATASTEGSKADSKHLVTSGGTDEVADGSSNGTSETDTSPVMAGDSDNSPSESGVKTIECLVHDPSGEPVSGAEVTVTEDDFSVTETTGPTGRCAFTIPTIYGSVEVAVVHGEDDPITDSIDVRQNNVVEIQLQPPEETEAEPESDEISQAELLAELERLDKEWSKDVDKVLMYSVGEYDPDDYADAFGSWDEALRQIGLGDELLKQSPTESEDEAEQREHRQNLLAELERLDEDWSKDVDKVLMYSVGEYKPADYEEEFGSWEAALDEADFDKTAASTDDAENESEVESQRSNAETSEPSQGGSSCEQLLEAIRATADQLGHLPNTVEMREYGSKDPSSAYTHFDSWSDALQAAESKETANQQPSDPESTSSPAATSSSLRDDGDVKANELAELYEAFGQLETMIDAVWSNASDVEKGLLDHWYEAVYEYWAGDGPDEAPSYGEQQNQRNDFSISEYREAFGDGTRVTQFCSIETIPAGTHHSKANLDIGLLDEGHRFIVPVSPNSDTPLPVAVSTESELETALDLLAEFPTYPDADIPASPGQKREQGGLSEGRLDEVVVEVVDVDMDTSERRDARLVVSHDSEGTIPLVIWSKHGVQADWQTGCQYRLEQARYKTWSAESGNGQRLSSTRDLEVIPVVEDDSTSESGQKQTTEASDESDDGSTDTDNGDIVDTVMNDLEF